MSLQQDRRPQERREEVTTTPTQRDTTPIQRENGPMTSGRTQPSSYEPTDDDFFFGGGPIPDEKPTKSSVKQVNTGPVQGKASRVTGRLQLKLFYDEEAANLNVTVVGAEGLAPKETTTPPNPYVRIYFLPDKSSVAGSLEVHPGGINDKVGMRVEFIFGETRKTAARAVKQKIEDVDPVRAKLGSSGRRQRRMEYGQAPDAVFTQNGKPGMYDPSMSPRPGTPGLRGPCQERGRSVILSSGQNIPSGMPPQAHHQGYILLKVTVEDGRTRRRNSLSSLPLNDSEAERPRSPFPIPSPVPLGHGRSQSSSSLHERDRGLPNG
ncbi:Regulating synaptic membrane exocytosis protein 2, partial [Desmophyllum pertusum]